MWDKNNFVLDFYSEETVNNQGLECLRFLNEVISDFDAVSDDYIVIIIRFYYLTILNL